jgi:hypothetical protein
LGEYAFWLYDKRTGGPMHTRPKIPNLFVLTLCLLITHSCATFKPLPIEKVTFKDRAQTQQKNNVRVTAAVLSAEESKKLFDLPLYDQGIQPIWIEIENKDEEDVWFAPVGLDPDYFAPLEVAYMNRRSFAGKTNRRMETYFHDQGITKFVPKGGIRSGFVFTNLDMGTKAFNIDIIGEDNQIRTFTFFISVPGLRVSHQDVDFTKLYSKEEMISYEDEEGLRRALEDLPCCSTNKDGTKKADPLNIVFVSSGDDLHRVLIRSGWNETEKVGPETTSGQTGSPTFQGQNKYAPVIPFFLYGRPQDAAFRKSRETVKERNEIRLWLSPMRFRDKPVWVGQISRDIPVRWLGSVYKIEPLVDEARTYIWQDIMYSNVLAKYGYVKGVGAATISNPHKTFQNDPYFTDGYRAVMWVSSNPVSFSEIEFLDWEIMGSRKQWLEEIQEDQ